MVGLGGFEPPTSPLSGVRSNQLSYRPAPRSRARQSQQSCALWARLAALAELGDVRNSSRYFVSRLALNLVMKGHEDGGQCSLEWKKLFLSPKRKALSADILRKEVIQPQVLLRLPCYDFTPIADPTLGRFLPCGLDHVRWVLPTLMV